MKIGIDARFWNETGVGRYIRNLVKQLHQIDTVNQYVLFIRPKDFEVVSAIIAKGDNKRWKIVRTDIPWHSIKEQIQFPHILNKEILDLMHFPYFSMPVFYNKPFVVTIHDLILHHFATGEASTKSKLIYNSKLFGYKKIIDTAAQKSKMIIAVSQGTKDEIVEHLKVPPGKIKVIYEGIDTKVISRNQVSIPNLKLENYFLHVGNLYPHKNMQLLLKAFEQLKKQSLPYGLVIAGKPDFFQKRFMEQVKKHNLESQIVSLGEVTDEQLSYLYQHSLALISSSLMEGFDLPSIEAMANKCLVLASDIPVHREICQDAAIYFESNNTTDLMLKLQHISESDKSIFRNNLQKGEKVITQYSWEEMAKQTLNIYLSTFNINIELKAKS